MSSRDEKPIVVSYLEKAMRTADGRHELSADELAWLLEHTTRINGLHLERLRGLQAALPAAQGESAASELKPLLADLIIMRSRLAGREETLLGLLGRLGESVGEAVPVDEAGLSAGLQEAMNASSHKTAVAGRRTGQ
jgi:hypothetical protein